MQIKLVADGRTAVRGAPLVVHNERLADPLDSITQALAEVTGKRKKTIEDHQEIARREFFGGLYTFPRFEWPFPDPLDVTIGLPSWNVLRCLQDGAKRSRRGPDILRGVSPMTEFAPLIYDGPQDPHELWKRYVATGEFALRKSVGVQKSRTMRTRGIFYDWRIELDVEVDAKVLDAHTVRFMWRDAGLYAGLGEMRPVYGRFIGEIEVVKVDDEELEAATEELTTEPAKTGNGKRRAAKVAA